MFNHDDFYQKIRIFFRNNRGICIISKNEKKLYIIKHDEYKTFTIIKIKDIADFRQIIEHNSIYSRFRSYSRYVIKLIFNKTNVTVSFDSYTTEFKDFKIDLTYPELFNSLNIQYLTDIDNFLTDFLNENKITCF